jgi:hypothetical protein
MSEFVHDWGPYNRHIDALADKVGRLPPQRAEPRSPTDWWSIAKAVGLVTLALGVAISFVIWAIREPEVLRSGIGANEFQPTVMRQFERGTAKAGSDQPKVVHNFVLFTERSLPAIGTIVTGWKFASQRDQRPTDQWCYLNPAHGGTVGVTPRIELGRFDVPNVPAVTLSQHHLTVHDLHAARKACAWFAGAR